MAAPEQWDLQGVPPGTHPNRPPARLILHGPACRVPFNDQQSIRLDDDCTAIYTESLADCSAFCVLYSEQHAGPWSGAYLAHIPGGPEPDFIKWNLIANTMPEANGCRHIAVLANARPSVRTETFLEELADQLPFILPENTWVYDRDIKGFMAFGVNSSAFAGEPG